MAIREAGGPPVHASKSMPISVTCRACGFEGRLREAQAGHVVRCPQCGERVLAPEVEGWEGEVALAERRTRRALRRRWREDLPLRNMGAFALRGALGFGGGGACTGVALFALLEASRDQAIFATPLWVLLVFALPGLLGAAALVWGLVGPSLRVIAGFGLGFLLCPSTSFFALLLAPPPGALGPVSALMVAYGVGFGVAGGVGGRAFGRGLGLAGAATFGVSGVLGGAVMRLVLGPHMTAPLAGGLVDPQLLVVVLNALPFALGGASFGAVLAWKESRP